MFIFFVLLSMLDMAVIKEDDQKANESFDDVVKRVY